jgi:hypothetical protein
MKDYTDTIKSCVQAFYAVCDCVMTKEQMKQWTTHAVLPDDFMDANMTLHDILVNHNIEVFNEDGEITDEGELIMEEAWKFADALNKKKNYPSREEFDYNKYFPSEKDFPESVILEIATKRELTEKVDIGFARACFAEGRIFSEFNKIGE